MARLDKTLIDYLIIAISPALIMTLVGSLVFFLLDVFYKGNYGGRLEIIFALFVFAAVLIARIAIEEGRERAMLFSVPLALVTLLAINKFVQFQDGWLASFSFFINCGLIALVWWSANQLTWDCTMIDEDVEDSGEGLMEAVGLEKPGKAEIQEEISSAVAQPEKSGTSEIRVKIASAARPGVEADDEKPRDIPLTWWRKFLDRRRRPHAPGVWVVYFSLAALPLFGIGQFFIPSAAQENRQYAFQLLFVYTASGLALLLTTSFLGLRRYLRRRKQEMPQPIVNLWLGIGASLVVAAMILALLMPRPNAEYDLSDLAVHVGSPDQNPSPHGVGQDGVEQNEPSANTKPSDDKDAQATTDQKTEKTSSQSSENGKEGKSQEGKSESQDKSKSNDSSPQTKPAEEKKEQNKENGGKSTTPNIPRPSLPSLTSVSSITWLLTFFKWIFYLLVAIVVAYAVWKNREALWKGFCDFVQFFIDLWHNLFGGKQRLAKAVTEAEAKKKRLPRFADFRDPFAEGVAGRYPPAELVRYTFDALEAWARDRGIPRSPDETPHEFARTVAASVPALGSDAVQLADLYSQVAYAPFTLPAGNAAQLSQLWQIMRAEALPVAAAS